MWKKYNVIEKYCKCNAKNESVYTITTPIQINDISNIDISGGGCSASDGSYGVFGTGHGKNAYNTQDMGSTWNRSDICGNLQNYVRGVYMSRNGKYSVFASDDDIKVFFSMDYGETYNYIGSLYSSSCGSNGNNTSFNNCYLNDEGTVLIITFNNGLYISAPQMFEFVYTINIGEVHNIATNSDFTNIWVPTSNGTYTFSYSENSDFFSQLVISSNWTKTEISELSNLNAWSASSSSSGNIIAIGAKQMNQGVYVSFNYGDTFTNIVDVLDSDILTNDTIQCGSISVSGDGYKMIVCVYQDAEYPIYICTLTKMLIYTIIKYDVHLPIDALSCGNTLVIYNTYSKNEGMYSITTAGTYFAQLVDTVTQPLPPEPIIPTTYNTSYNTIQQSCKMRYAQTIRTQFKPNESINITGGNPYGNMIYLNSQTCKRALNNFAGMPAAPVLSGEDTFYSFENVSFRISVQPDITVNNIVIYYYQQIINDNLTITGSNGEFIATFNILLKIGTYNIYSTCKNRNGRKSLPSQSYNFTVISKTIEPLTDSTVQSAVDAWVNNPDDAQFTDIYNDPYYGEIGEWNTIAVTNMSGLFYNKSTFNSDISKWNISNVITMANMFEAASSFSQNISGWKTSKVTNMESMFKGASAFNTTIGDWDTSKVTNMDSMFGDAVTFNKSISNWDTSNVTNMSYMFSGAKNFAQDISWNTSKVTNMESLFEGASTFNGNISNWDTSNVVYMNDMFNNADVFNNDISKWNTSSVINMSAMFKNAQRFNGDISGWNTYTVTNMNEMFSNCTDFNKNISDWDTSNVTNMACMFKSAKTFDQNIQIWNTNEVTNFTNMFSSALAMNDTYNGTSGYGNTPTQEFFNQSI